MSRYITVWRKAGRPMDWDFYVSENEQEAGEVVNNLTRSGVNHYSTYPIGDRVADLSLGCRH